MDRLFGCLEASFEFFFFFCPFLFPEVDFEAEPLPLESLASSSADPLLPPRAELFSFFEGFPAPLGAEFFAIALNFDSNCLMEFSNFFVRWAVAS